MKHIFISKTYAFLYFFVCFSLISCNSGSNTISSQNQLITIDTYNYNPGNKTAVNISVGGSAPIKAEIDTGSDMTVVNESFIGPNIIKTTESLSITYGGGQNTVSGYLAYGSVTFTTSNGTTISSESTTPILVVTSGSVDEGGGNNAILGLRMNNQVSVKLYLPSPYNQMMILNRPLNRIIFGELSISQINKFANIQGITTTCINYKIVPTQNNQCWILAESAVNYTVTEFGGSESNYNYETLFDSGEGFANFYLSPVPIWMSYDSNNVILTPISVTANTSQGPIPIPLTTQSYYHNSSGNTVNPGNNLFNYYQILFDQVDGVIGFQNYNNPL